MASSFGRKEQHKVGLCVRICARHLPRYPLRPSSEEHCDVGHLQSLLMKVLRSGDVKLPKKNTAGLRLHIWGELNHGLLELEDHCLQLYSQLDGDCWRRILTIIHSHPESASGSTGSPKGTGIAQRGQKWSKDPVRIHTGVRGAGLAWEVLPGPYYVNVE